MLVVQQFNQPFARVHKALASMARLGVTHVLISPPQKSHSSRQWWGRYQPVDFRRIEGPLGSLSELRSLCEAASARGMAIVADTVLSHLSNEGRYLELSRGRIVRAQYPHFCQWDLKGLHYLGRGRGLPLLDLDKPWVREQLRDYVHGLFGLGVRGYRFDSAKHMDPEFFRYVLEGLPPLLCFGELVYSHPRDFPSAYWRSMRAYDFPLAAALRRAFAPGGDLGGLLGAEHLAAGHSIPFVNHHDTVHNRRGFSAFRVEDALDRRLAYVYVLGAVAGVPLVYYTDLRSREVKAAMRFRAHCEGSGVQWLGATRTVLAWRRGGLGVAAINKGGSGAALVAAVSGGVYRELVSGERRRFGDGESYFEVPARGAVVWVREG